MINKTDLLQLISDSLPDNITREISPLDLRSVLNEMVDSQINIISNTDYLGLAEWNATLQYQTGEAVIVDNKIYKAIVNPTYGTYIANQWVQIAANIEFDGTNYILKDNGIELDNSKKLKSLADNYATISALTTGLYEVNITNGSIAGLDKDYPTTGRLILEVYDGVYSNNSQITVYVSGVNNYHYVKKRNESLWYKFQSYEVASGITVENGINQDISGIIKLGGILTDHTVIDGATNEKTFDITGNGINLTSIDGSSIIISSNDVYTIATEYYRVTLQANSGACQINLYDNAYNLIVDSTAFQSVSETEGIHVIKGGTTGVPGVGRLQLFNQSDYGLEIYDGRTNVDYNSAPVLSEFTANTVTPKSYVDNQTVLLRDQRANGFPYVLSGMTLSYNNSNQTLSLAFGSDSNSYFYVQGVKYDMTGITRTLAHANTTGLYVYYFDEVDTNLNVALYDPNNMTDLILNKCLVAYVYRDVFDDTNILMDERHGFNMSPATHLHLHGAIGTKIAYCEGLKYFTIGDGSLATHAQFGWGISVCMDEDLIFQAIDTAAGSTMYNLYLSGAVAAPTMFVKTNNSPVVRFGGSTTRANYNLLSAGTWSIAEATSNNFVIYHIVFLNNRTYPIASIAGFAEYSTLNLARAGVKGEIGMILDYYSSSLLPEKAILGSIIVQTNTSYTNTYKSKIVEVSTGVNYENFCYTDLKLMRQLKSLGLV